MPLIYNDAPIYELQDTLRPEHRRMYHGLPYYPNEVGATYYSEKFLYLRWIVCRYGGEYDSREIIRSEFFPTLRGRVHCCSFGFCFETRHDAMMFKLTYGTGEE